jgi:DNA-binding NarL/FixJ family response regulator
VPPVRLAIANDYEIVVRGLAALLAGRDDRVEIVDLSVATIPSASADVLLYDVFGCGEVHTGDVRALIDDSPWAVAVFTWNHDDHLIELALANGVRGYLSKGLDADSLVDAIERIARGEIVVARPASSAGGADRCWPGKVHDLSEREAEVLALITQGYDNETIARRLYISPNTLKSRIRQLYRRMGFTDRVQAAIWGVKHGFETDSGATARTRDAREL